MISETDVAEVFTCDHLELEDRSRILAEGGAAETVVDDVAPMGDADGLALPAPQVTS